MAAALCWASQGGGEPVMAVALFKELLHKKLFRSDSEQTDSSYCWDESIKLLLAQGSLSLQAQGLQLTWLFYHFFFFFFNR